jgi:small subunit ribosomal protein S7
MLEQEHSSEYLKKRFVASLMRGGKRSTAENIVKKALVLLKEQGLKPQTVFLEALNNSAHLLEVVGQKRGRSKILVPRPVTPKKRLGLALKWIVNGARTRTESSMSERLAYELLALSKGQGNAIRQKIALHQLAFKNRNNTYLKGKR